MPREHALGRKRDLNVPQSDFKDSYFDLSERMEIREEGRGEREGIMRLA
jgi:hypothetical protein